MANINRLAQLTIDIVLNARRSQQQLQMFTKDVKHLQAATKALGVAFGTLVVAGGTFIFSARVTSEIISTLKSLSETFAEFEKQLLDVAKISKTSDLRVLAQDFRDLSSALGGVDFQQISDVMAAVARTGVRDTALKQFTETALRLADISGDLGAQEAAEGLKFLVDNFNLADDAAENLAAGIDALSDNFNTTTGRILTSSARLAGVAQAINVSVTDLNATVATLLSTGQTPTVIRSSLTKVLLSLNKDTINIGRGLGFVDNELRSFVNNVRNDGITALSQFATAMRNLPIREQIALQRQMGIEGSRVDGVIKALMFNTEKLAKAREVSAKATNEGVAAIQKQLKVLNQTSKQIVLIKQAWIDFQLQLSKSVRVLDLLHGSLISLNLILERFETGIMPRMDLNIKDPEIFNNNLPLIKAQIKTLKGMRELQIEALRAQNKGVFNAFTGFFRTQEMMSQLNAIDRQIEAFEKLKKTIEDAAKEKAEFDKKGANEIDFNLEIENALKDAIPDFQNLLPQVGGIAGKINDLDNQLVMFQQQLAALGDIGVERLFIEQAVVKSAARVREELAKLADAEKKAADAKNREAALNRIEGLLGPFGPMFKLLQQARELGKLGVVQQNEGLRKAIAGILAAQFDELGRGQQQQVRFRGLTEAWKEAQNPQNDPKIPLLRAQKKLAEELLKEQKQNNDLIQQKLQMIELNTRNNGRIGP